MRTSTFLFALLLSVAAWADDVGARCLVVETADGSVAYYDFGTNPEIRFNGSALTIATDAETVEYGEREVKQYYFAVRDDGSATAVATPKAADLVVRRVNGDELQINGASCVALLTVDGKAVSGRATADGDGVRVNLSNLPKGVYLININNKRTIKIQR